MAGVSPPTGPIPPPSSITPPAEKSPIATQKAMTAGAQTVAAALATYPRIKALMQERFALKDHLECLHGLMLISDREVKALNRLLREAEILQSKRPTIYAGIAPQVKALLDCKRDNDQADLLLEPEILQNVCREVIDMTAVINTQILHENIAMLFDPSPVPGRATGELKIRYPYSYTTSRERHVDKQFLNDSDHVQDFQLTTDAYITNEKTMETRCLHKPLPFNGEMTVTEARKLLELLEATIANPQRFDEKYEALNLPTDKQKEQKVVFTNWVAEAEIELGQLTCDFNSTPTRPATTFALETQAIQNALAQPQSEQLALKAAMTKNIFLVEGKLSLLPPGVAEKHPHVASLSPEEIKTASQLTVGVPVNLKVAVSESQIAAVTLVIQESTLEGKPCLRLDTTFAADGKTHTRKTVYLLERGVTPTERISSLVTSHLLERTSCWQRQNLWVGNHEF